MIADATVGAVEDPIASASSLVPSTAFEMLSRAGDEDPDGAMRLARLLVDGRFQPRLTVETVLAAQPSWLQRGRGLLESALGAYANEHGHQDLALEAFVRAAGRASSDAARLLSVAALLAILSGDRDRAADLVGKADAAGGESLLLSIARAQVELGEAGIPAVDRLLAEASPQQLVAEPTCLMFLGEQAGRRGELDVAARYFETALAAHPRLVGARLGLARVLIGKVAGGKSTIAPKDQRRAAALAMEVREEVRGWAGPSELALVITLQEGMLSGAFNAVVELATPQSLGGAAVDREASFGEVAIYGAQAAIALRDRTRAAWFADLVCGTAAETFIRALTADPMLPREDRIPLWHAGLLAARTFEHQRRALYELAVLGVADPDELDDFRERGVIDETQRDIILARSEAVQGRVQQAVMRLRQRAPSDPGAAEVLVEVLRAAGRFDEALDECDRGLERFGPGKLAHDKLNTLVSMGRIGEANALARQLLAGPELAVEQRLALRRALVDSHAQGQHWTEVERECREALAEDLDAPDLAWWLIAAQHNQGRLEAAWMSLRELNPQVTVPGYVGLWLALHAQFGFTEDDIRTALGFLSRWPHPKLAALVLGCLLEAGGRQTPDGGSVLPAIDETTTEMFQAALSSYTRGHPDGPIQVVDLEEISAKAILAESPTQRTSDIDMLAARVRAGTDPLGALAAGLGRSYTQMLVERACGPLHAVTANPRALEQERKAAAAAIDGDVTIDVSALAVATIPIDRWSTLRSAFTNVRLPRLAFADIGAAWNELMQAPGSSYLVTYDPGQHTLTRIEMPLTDHQLQRQRIIDIRRAAGDLTLVDGAAASRSKGEGPQPVAVVAVGAEGDEVPVPHFRGPTPLRHRVPVHRG
jgi:tetratricopeptide (TPR) repeat protein